MSAGTYITYDEAMARLSISRSTLEKLLREGLLVSTRLPGTTCRRISEQALADYLNPPDTGEVIELRERRA